MAGELADTCVQSALDAFELRFYEGGVQVRRSLRVSWNACFERVDPVRAFHWSKGGGSYAGWHWSATTGGHVGYESWLERDRLILLDADPDVKGIASQPFWLHWHGGSRKRRHAPDYFVRLADGRCRVVDVRASDQIDETTADAFEATERACRAVGWEFVRVGVPDPVLMANMRWLSRYRRSRCGRRPELAERLVSIFQEPAPLLAGAARAGDLLLVLPVLFHLLWNRTLVTDVTSQLLAADSFVQAVRGE
ncbi:TnsA-like heteromeric transposase endonuclease subunit (plasmid) [Streptomyces sp. NBC_01426]|uniref:TnsA-like heteromeric transposase endonuclease subunit n=1 Tax=Streptomyces sp. NBC_01426 TaxID=2975866 RepID=UPI002E336027|nr:TnsA-like heteromeric transposase endonuclease subunit [Streptomyces sp. NBC_01426]